MAFETRLEILPKSAVSVASCPDSDVAEAGLVSTGLLAVVEVTVSIGAELIGLVWMPMMFYPRPLYRQLMANTFPFQR
jgi:hypothetical protein